MANNNEKSSIRPNKRTRTGIDPLLFYGDRTLTDNGIQKNSDSNDKKRSKMYLNKLTYSKQDQLNKKSLIDELNENQLNELNNKSIINVFKGELNLIKTKLDQIQSNLNQSNLDQSNSIKTDDLNFKLNWQLKDNLIMILNSFTALLYDNKNLDDQNLNEKLNNFMHNLVDLPLKLDNEIELNSELLKPTLVLNSQMKTEITNLLIQNKNFSILFNNSNKDAKLNLINKNNNLVMKLMKFPIQMLKDDLFNSDLVWTKISKSQSICNLENKSIELKNSKLINEITNLKESFTSKKEATFIYELNNVKDFFTKNQIDLSPSFNCLNLDWYMKFFCENNNRLKCSLVLINNLDLNRKCTANLNLKILAQDKINHYLSNDLKVIYTKSESHTFKTVHYYNFLLSNGFIKDNKIIFQLFLKCNWI